MQAVKQKLYPKPIFMYITVVFRSVKVDYYLSTVLSVERAYLYVDMKMTIINVG
jgi:hypothetical protein